MKKYIDTGHDTSHGTVTTYVTGFIISILLTLAAYVLVAYELVEARWAVYGIVVLAIAQLLAQLFFFLHMGNEKRPRWNIISFAFATMVVLILVFGSLWIMKHLDYHSMSPADLDASIIQDEGITP